ncbi:MAG: DUF6447 family protein [Methylobacter sp.]|nr:DUF6447 family protein [Methylobacter sp.]
MALDPFPFTGGLTSCESLWMGVPVVTWPQDAVVSRQTFALLSAIGLVELAAQDADDYVRIAVELASNTEHLAQLRKDLRNKIQHSPLMDVQGFTAQLEQCFIDLYQDIDRKNMTTIKIDNKDYELESLSDEARAQLANVQFVDQELQRLNAQAAVLQTARLAYAKALTDALPKTDSLVFGTTH